jgi:uroporphyrinogen-III decarboxylase
MRAGEGPDRRELFLSVLSGTPSEDIPVFLRDLTLGLDALDVNTDEVFGPEYNAKLSAACVLELQRRIGHDAVVGSIHTYSLEAFGGTTVYPAKGIPYMSDPPFADLDSMERYVPEDICDRLMEGMRESYRIVRKKAPHLAEIMNVGGPVNTAGNLRGLETLMMDVILNPDVVSGLMAFSEGVIRSTAEYIGTDCADALFLAAASDNPDMLGLEEYKKISLPHVKSITEFCHGMGLPVIFHPHGLFSTGDRRDVLKASLDTGVDGFQFAEDNTPEGILKETRGRCCVMGGLDAFNVLLLGPDERIVRSVDSVLDVLFGEDYIMTCSCSVNRGMPLDNVKTMVDAARAYCGRSS